MLPFRRTAFFVAAATVLTSGCNKDKAPQSKPTSERVKKLISEMTLDEKIGQLTMFSSDRDVSGPSINKDYENLIKEGKVGAVFNAYEVDFVNKLQHLAVDNSRLKIPLLFGYDVIHGYKTIFPIPLGQACSWELDTIEKAESIAAKEASAQGVHLTFAPMVDIARDPRWGRVSEGAGEDTWLGSRIAEARVKGFQKIDLKDPTSLMACVKHFAGYGAPEAGKDYNVVDMSNVSLLEWYLPPYHAAVDAGAGAVMPSFNEIGGMPSTANSWLLTDVLRNQWKFDGFTVSDYTAVSELEKHGVAADDKEAVELAINAGVDMDMQSGTYLNNLKALVQENKVSMSTIDNAVRDVLVAKEKLGLFDDPYRSASTDREKNDVFTPEHRQFAREFVAKSSVLLKNEKDTLPIPSDVNTIAVIGPLGDSPENMFGNWSAAGDSKNSVSLLKGIQDYVGDNVKVSYEKGCNVNIRTDSDRADFDKALKLANDADVIVLALGEKGDASMNGEAASRAYIDLPGIQDDLVKEIMKAVKDKNKRVVAVLFNGRPLTINTLVKEVPAILEAWYGGTEAGNGIADILFGKYNPSGKLTMTFPRDVGQIPIHYNSKPTGRPCPADDPFFKWCSRYIDDPSDALFPFGFGLSYTKFDYSNLAVSVNGKEITIKADIKNAGPRDGDEIVQLYVGDNVGKLTRPTKELKGFSKVSIPVGQTKTVSFTLTENDLSYVHSDLTRSWDPGEFIVYVGRNSQDTPLAAKFTYGQPGPAPTQISMPAPKPIPTPTPDPIMTVFTISNDADMWVDGVFHSAMKAPYMWTDDPDKSATLSETEDGGAKIIDLQFNNVSAHGTGQYHGVMVFETQDGTLLDVSSIASTGGVQFEVRVLDYGETDSLWVKLTSNHWYGDSTGDLTGLIGHPDINQWKTVKIPFSSSTYSGTFDVETLTSVIETLPAWGSQKGTIHYQIRNINILKNLQ